MSDDPLNDLLGKLGESPQDLTARIRGFGRQAGVTALLVPKLNLVCAPPTYTLDDMVEDKPDVARQWAEELEQAGFHVTVDAIELSYNAPGGFDPEHLRAYGYGQKEVDLFRQHADHPHVAMTCMVATSSPALERN